MSNRKLNLITLPNNQIRDILLSVPHDTSLTKEKVLENSFSIGTVMHSVIKLIAENSDVLEFGGMAGVHAINTVIRNSITDGVSCIDCGETFVDVSACHCNQCKINTCYAVTSFMVKEEEAETIVFNHDIQFQLKNIFDGNIFDFLDLVFTDTEKVVATTELFLIFMYFGMYLNQDWDEFDKRIKSPGVEEFFVNISFGMTERQFNAWAQETMPGYKIVNPFFGELPYAR